MIRKSHLNGDRKSHLNGDRKSIKVINETINRKLK